MYKVSAIRTTTGECAYSQEFADYNKAYNRMRELADDRGYEILESPMADGYVAGGHGYDYIISLEEVGDEDEPTEPTRYARKCTKTGKGMDEGYCFEDGLAYFADKEDAEAYAILQCGFASLDEAYDAGAYCWTAWDWEDEEYYYEEQADGTLKEIWKDEQ